MDEGAPATEVADTHEDRDREPDRVDRLMAGRTRRRAARTRDLAALLQQRPDLEGVYLPADLTLEAVRWCA